MSQAIERFFEAWGEPDAATRARHLRAAISPDISYADPRTPDRLTDPEALIAYVAMYTQYAPGATARVVALSETLALFRATVEFRMSDGKTQLGQYFIECDDDARPTRMIGFAGLGAAQ
ncbi:molecular chaperone GroEL [Shimia sp.]|uniref:molecular chaperone GroEL n=1 Tax=Shimia sp. TaxID=1954381 RepID=UPI0035622168